MKKKTVISFLKGIATALAITVIGIALTALFAKTDAAGGSTVTLVLTVIKIVSIAAGTFIALKGIGKKGVAVGATVAFIYRLLCFLITLFTKDGTVFVLSSLAELAFSTVIGMISGAIIINLVKK